MKPVPEKEEIDAMEAGGAGRGAEPTTKAPEAPVPAAPKKEKTSNVSAMLMVALLFFAADICKNVVESNVNSGFGKRINTSWLTFILAFANLVLAFVLTYVRQGSKGLRKLPDLEKIRNFAMPAVFFGAQASLMQLATIFLTSGSMRKVLCQMRIPFIMVSLSLRIALEDVCLLVSSHLLVESDSDKTGNINMWKLIY